MHKLIQNQYFSFAFTFLVLFFFTNNCFAAFTITDEKKLGKEFYDKLNQNNFLLKDKQLNDYVSKIGNLVLAQSNKAPFDFHFSIVNSSAINAFATPGGYIYVHKGLINAVEDEAELAGVIAHEIAHANARHIASIIEKSQKLTIATLAALIASAFLGGGGEAAAAIAAFSVAGASSLTLKYQREHEEEADRLGISYLVEAGYSPPAMVDFLKLIKKYDFLSKTIPSYLKTHPGTDDRIFYLESLLLTKYHQKGAKNIVGNLKRMQALIPLAEADLNARQKQLKEDLAKDPNNIDLLYALALTEDKLGQINSAIENLQKVINLSPRDEDALKNIGLIYLKTGKVDLAKLYLQRAVNLNSENDEIALALANVYFTSGNYQSALNSYLKLKNKTDDADINYHIAMAYGKLNNQGESHYYFGLHFKKSNKKESALFHFKEALNYFSQGSQRASAINREISELKTEPPPSKNPPKQ